MTTVTICTPWLDATELGNGYWRAIETGLRDGDRTIIIDNGSDPALSDVWPDRGEWATFVRFNRNIGFSRACNVGLDRADTDAVLFLNNDVRMVNGAWLADLRAALAPGVLVGSQLRSDPHTAVDGRTIPYLDGWCIGGMTDELQTLGGWNEDFEEPAYYGDNELCVRAQANGLRLAAVPVGLRHLSNYTSRRMDISGVSARNRARYEAAVRALLAQQAAA